jgi:LysM repeat protein
MADKLKHALLGLYPKIKKLFYFLKDFFFRLFSKTDRKFGEQALLVVALALILIPGEIIFKRVVIKSYQFNETEANLSYYTDKAYPQYVENLSHTVLYYFSTPAIASESELAEMETMTEDSDIGGFVVYDGGFLSKDSSPDGVTGGLGGRRQVMTYIVQSGDTPGKIASEFGISLNTLIWANNLKNGNLIKPGQELVILPVSGVKYTIKSGDTLSKIASTYKVDVQKIKDFNNLSGDTLMKGDSLIIPDGKMPTVTYIPASQATEIKNSDLSVSKGNYFIPPTTGWNWGELHSYNAVDFANRCGTPIYAAAGGIVTVITNNGGWNSGYGNHIRIQHPSGALTVYAHLSVVNVQVGQEIAQGQVIGAIGNTGNVKGPTGCHLHFEVRGLANPFAK